MKHRTKHGLFEEYSVVSILNTGLPVIDERALLAAGFAERSTFPGSCYR
jgi:membrane protein YqaA with SNARE-associated domain